MEFNTVHADFVGTFIFHFFIVYLHPKISIFVTDARGFVHLKP